MSSPPVKVTEGYIPFVREGKTYQTYYKIFGDLENRTRTPVVGVHGGPGLVHDYLVALADLARDAAFPVILYDQLGNGRSSRVPAARAGFWSVALFLDELENLLAALGARGAFHLVGHSWGGMLGADFAATRRPRGLRRLVVCDAPAAHALWLRSFGALLAGFPAWVRDAVARGFEDGAAPLWRALQEVYAVHGCRAKPFPPELERTLLHVYGEGADRTVQKQE